MELQENILNIALHNFFSKGLRQVSMDDIAKEAGISKRTLYEIYKSKELLIADVVCKTFDTTLTQMEHLVDDMKQRGCNMVEILCHIYILSRKSKEPINKVVFDELRKYYPEINGRQFAHLHERHDRLFRQLYADCKASGFIREDINTDLIFQLLKDLSDDKLGYVSSGKYTTADIASYLVVPLIRSIGTHKGHRAFFKTIQSLDDPYIKHLKNLLSL
ncbi:MAG: TetR/AcrR family transcriptional regulator [Bacteroidales bacterium]|nr:TetR/AcrR family transcriptional regulator [Bacteroidales bacterium]